MVSLGSCGVARRSSSISLFVRQALKKSGRESTSAGSSRCRLQRDQRGSAMAARSAAFRRKFVNESLVRSTAFRRKFVNRLVDSQEAGYKLPPAEGRTTNTFPAL